MLIFE
jgi:hypothetical protein